MECALLRSQMQGLVHRVPSDLGQPGMLQPFLQLAGVGILNRPREAVGRCSRRAIRKRQFSVEDRRAHHLIERQGVGEFWRAAKRQHDVGENWEAYGRDRRKSPQPAMARSARGSAFSDFALRPEK